VIRHRACLILLVLYWASAARSEPLAPFSGMPPGEIAAPWQMQTIRGRTPAEFRIINENDGIVEAVANAAVASLFHPVQADATSMSILTWRWRVLDAVDGSDLYSKSGDDYPARVYVLFDYDIGGLPFRARWQLRLARLIYGPWVPGAALCYVAANGVKVGTITPNAYTDRVQMIVVADEGNRDNGEWQSFSRNIAEDFAAAFGEPAPPVLGIAIAIDTDDTGESAVAWFGDIELSH